MPDLKLYFSLISGDLYYVESDEIKNLDSSQVPLKQKPKSSCKQCYGRFYTGRHLRLNEDAWDFDHYSPCPKCSPKCIDWETVGDNEIKVQTPKVSYSVDDHVKYAESS